MYATKSSRVRHVGFRRGISPSRATTSATRARRPTSTPLSHRHITPSSAEEAAISAPYRSTLLISWPTVALSEWTIAQHRRQYLICRRRSQPAIHTALAAGGHGRCGFPSSCADPVSTPRWKHASQTPYFAAAYSSAEVECVLVMVCICICVCVGNICKYICKAEKTTSGTSRKKRQCLRICF